MTLQSRRLAFLVGAGILAVLLVRGMAALPSFGTSRPRYGEVLAHLAVRERAVTNTVTGVLFDLRGLDTLGEEFILFAAVVGVSLLLRELSSEREESPEEELPGRETPEESELVRLSGILMAGVFAWYGAYIVLHAHLTPGGGFQGGVVIAAALLLVYLAIDYEAFHRIAPVPRVQALEGIGAGGLVLAGLLGLPAGKAFLHNFLPLGTPGNLGSGGLIPILNFSTGLAVLAGFVLLMSEFIRQTVILRQRRWFR